jgi:hypothetical protein
MSPECETAATRVDQTDAILAKLIVKMVFKRVQVMFNIFLSVRMNSS